MGLQECRTVSDKEKNLQFETHHGDGVIEQRLSEHEDVQQLVDVDLLEDGQDGDGVHGWDDGSEQQAGQQVYAAQLSSLDLAHGVHHPADEEGVPQRAHHCEHQDGAQVLHEGTDGKEVAGIDDDGRQQVEEEERRVEDRGFASNCLEGAAYQQADDNQQTTLWNDVRKSGNNVKTCREKRFGDISSSIAFSY